MDTFMTLPLGKLRKIVIPTLLLDPEYIFIFCFKGIPTRRSRKGMQTKATVITCLKFLSSHQPKNKVLCIIKIPGDRQKWKKKYCAFNVRRVCLALYTNNEFCIIWTAFQRVTFLQIYKCLSSPFRLELRNLT